MEDHDGKCLTLLHMHYHRNCELALAEAA